MQTEKEPIYFRLESRKNSVQEELRSGRNFGTLYVYDCVG